MWRQHQPRERGGRFSELRQPHAAWSPGQACVRRADRQSQPFTSAAPKSSIQPLSGVANSALAHMSHVCGGAAPLVCETASVLTPVLGLSAREGSWPQRIVQPAPFVARVRPQVCCGSGRLDFRAEGFAIGVKAVVWLVFKPRLCCCCLLLPTTVRPMDLGSYATVGGGLLNTASES